MTSIIVEKCVFIGFLAFYILQAGPSKRDGARVTSPPCFFDRPGCINNVLINALKKINASTTLVSTNVLSRWTGVFESITSRYCVSLECVYAVALVAVVR